MKTETKTKTKNNNDPIVRVAQGLSGTESGSVLVANIIVGLAIGYGFQWQWPQSKPWGLLGGLVLGIVSGFYQLFKREAMLAKKWHRQHDAAKKDREKL